MPLTILLVDDNRDLLHFLERLMADSGWDLLTAETGTEARRLVQEHKPSAALVDYMLQDADGVELAAEFLNISPGMVVIIMTAAQLSPEAGALIEEHRFHLLRKPFLASDVINLLRNASGNHNNTDLVVPSRALKVFVSYCHSDEIWEKRLEKHLSMLKRMGIVHSWHDRMIAAGDDFNEAIDRYLSVADLVLLLISPDFLSSDYCYNKEMKGALKRHEQGNARVIPVMVRPVDWDKAPFAHLQAVPKNAKAITLWANKDEALMDAAKSIRKVAEDLSATLHRL